MTKGNNMNNQKPNIPAQQAKAGADNDAKAAYEAKQVRDVRQSVARAQAPHILQRQEPTEKANKEPQPEGHLNHTHDHLPPQMPFGKDTRKPDGKNAGPKSSPAAESKTQGEDNDYYNGMSQ